MGKLKKDYGMGKDSGEEDMSDVYRRIKKKRARERKRRQIRKRRLRIGVCTVFAAALILLIIFLVKGCLNDDKESNNSRKVNLQDFNTIAENKDNVLKHTSYYMKAEIIDTSIPAIKGSLIKYPSVDGKYVSIVSEEVKSPYVALLCVEDNKLIAGRNSLEKIYPASMTKVMTLIVAVENMDDMDDTFTMSYDIVHYLILQGASRAGFEEGEEVKIQDLLYGLILPSGADAAMALAEKISGSEEEFVKLMNKKCEELGLKNTHFMNTTGLHDKDQYTTPLEMTVIMSYAMQNEICAQILSTYEYTTEPTAFHPEGMELVSSMFSRLYGDEAEGALIIAGKTGYTAEAGNCLVSFAVKGGKHYAAVSAGASSKWHVVFDAFELYGNYVSAEGINEDMEN